METLATKIKREKQFEDEKIKIVYSIGTISTSLSVYLKDRTKLLYHILLQIYPDRNHQNFDKANDKIREFVVSKINEWVIEDEEYSKQIYEQLSKQKTEEELRLKRLIDSF